MLEVHGKDNLGKFREFLEIWKIKSYVFADLDFLPTLAPDTKDLLAVDDARLRKSLGDKDSEDGRALLELLHEISNKNNQELRREDVQGLAGLFRHIENRHIGLKNDITEEDRRKIGDLIEEQYQDNYFILKDGEIEDYFGKGHFDISRAIEASRSMTRQTIPNEIEKNLDRVFND